MIKERKTLIRNGKVKAQFKMHLDQDLVEHLEKLAARTHRRSGQEVVEEVLAIYLPVWSAVADANSRVVAAQVKREIEATGATA